MGLFSKIWKGIKKTVKKVGRGIKKVINKVGKAFGKLGIVGQIGLMFLMPHMMAGLGTFWNGFGQFASKLAGPGSSAIGQAFGKVLSSVHTAGSMVGKVYTGISNTISSAVDVVTGRGTLGDLRASAESIFSGPTDVLKNSFKPKVPTDSPVVADALVEGKTIPTYEEIKIPTIQDAVNNRISQTQDQFKLDTANLLDPDMDLSKYYADTTTAKVTEEALNPFQQFIQGQGDKVKKAFTEFDLGEQITGSITSGLTQGIEQKTVEQIVGKAPDPIFNSTILKMTPLVSNMDKTEVVNGVDLSLKQQSPNSFFMNGIQNYDYLQSGFIQNEDDWFRNRDYAVNMMEGL